MSKTGMDRLRAFAATDTHEAALRALLDLIDTAKPEAITYAAGGICYSLDLVGALERARAILVRPIEKTDIHGMIDAFVRDLDATTKEREQIVDREASLRVAIGVLRERAFQTQQPADPRDRQRRELLDAIAHAWEIAPDRPLGYVLSAVIDPLGVAELDTTPDDVMLRCIEDAREELHRCAMDSRTPEEIVDANGNPIKPAR